MADTVTILAIESSCDETSAAVVRNGRTVLSNVIYSQISIHREYGGVVPEIASRKHIEKINQVIEKALADADVKLSEIDAVAVTYGPGLVGPLLVGVSEAKAIAYACGRPLVGVHHIKGHICANYIEHPELEPPYLCLVVSGGHTHLVHVKDYCEYSVIAQTRDDAAGEAFDKVARAIGLGYPGGVQLDILSDQGDPGAIGFPRAHVDEAPLDFSFSGIKSAVLNYLNSSKMAGTEVDRADLAASFQKAVVDVLVDHTMEAVEKLNSADKEGKPIQTVTLAGGVAANRALRTSMQRACKDKELGFYMPSPVYCTDNAAMIGAAGYYEYMAGVRHDLDLNALPNLPLE